MFYITACVICCAPCFQYELPFSRKCTSSKYCNKTLCVKILYNYTAKDWIIGASARFCPGIALVSFPTWLLGRKSRSARQIALSGAVAADKVSICMWACLACHAHCGHVLGCTQWVPNPSVVGMFCLPSRLPFLLFSTSISSSPAPRSSSLSWIARQAAFKKLVPLVSQLSTLGKTSAKEIHCDEAAGNSIT